MIRDITCLSYHKIEFLQAG